MENVPGDRRLVIFWNVVLTKQEKQEVSWCLVKQVKTYLTPYFF